MELTSYASPKMEMDNTQTVEDLVAFFIVAGYVLLALGATLILGAIAWCFMYARSSFEGTLEQVNGGGWKFKIGCK
ncbi:hypothetical protein LIT25_27210 (plasmid) [Bacillus sp. F19]|nr:hypothetical protein LIT25_27210 [Bacillus sp. F19]